MSKTQIFLSVGALLLVIALFLLPKVVVDNEESASVQNPDESAAPTSSLDSVDLHNSALAPESESLVNILRENINNSDDNKKIVIFADSLADVFKKHNLLDSAAKYLAVAADKNATFERFKIAGDAYYEAFTFAMDASKANDLAEKSRSYYTKAKETGSGDKKEVLDMDANMAMTYIASSNPMKGIGMLTEILEKDSEHEAAIFNLGILSIQSTQYDKAVERFEKLVSLYPDNLQAQFYLGLSYMESGDKRKARKQFEKVKELDSDPEVQATVDSYLEEIK